MGSKLLATDMLISEMVIPMTNAYHHSDFHKACVDLNAINRFLFGFGEGIENFPKPPQGEKGKMGLETRMNYHANHSEQCCRYYETNYPVVMERMGAYQRAMLKAIEAAQYQIGDVSA